MPQNNLMEPELNPVPLPTAPPTAAPAGGDTTPAATPPAPRELMASNFQAPTAPMPTPTTNEVGPQETVSGQLKELLSADSPYLEQGRQAGLTAASQRGLQNSTMAVQAGEQGRIAAALPIAQQDANTYTQRATLNQNTTNRFAENEMDHLQSMIERAQQGDINSQLQLEQYGYNSQLSAQDNIQRLQQLAAQGDIQAQLALQQFGFSTQLQGQQGEIQSRLQGEQYQWNSQLSEQENIQRLEQMAAQGDINANLALQQFGFDTQLSSQGAAQRLIEQAAQGDINSRLQMEQFGFNSELSAQENIQRLEQLAAQGDVEARMKLLDFNYTTLTNATQQGYALSLNDQQFQHSQNLLMQEYAERSGLSAQESQQRIDQLNASHANTLEEILARTDAEGQVIDQQTGAALQRDYLSNVAARQQAASEEIRTIMTTEGLTSAQQYAAVASAQRRMSADIAALQRFYMSAPQWDDSINYNPDAVPGGPSTPQYPVLPGGSGISTPGPGTTPTYPSYSDRSYDTR